jgi:L-lactate dehydrogenase complex protein LldG
MTAQNEILNAIRRHRLQTVEPPTHDGGWITYSDPQKQFAEALDAVKGRCFRADDLAGVNEQLERLSGNIDSQQICSVVPGVGRSNVDLDNVDDPHDLDDVDLAIVPGQLAVAENGAVWVTDAGIKHRAILFVSRQLVLVVPAGELVNNMHEAYERIADRTQSSFLPVSERQPGFGVFISGPSKTGDIEQILVIGAHGPRSLTVFLVDSDI